MTTLNPPFKAVNMDGLYRAVLSGSYPKIPDHYSFELSKVIRHLLQVNPAKRPSCDQILQSRLVQTYFDNYETTNMNTLNDYGFDNTLLKTIHIPSNLNQLSDLLPKSKYEEDKPVLQP
jgi:NIMA (never in mitosis gene a)-related kinase